MRTLGDQIHKLVNKILSKLDNDFGYLEDNLSDLSVELHMGLEVIDTNLRSRISKPNFNMFIDSFKEMSMEEVGHFIYYCDPSQSMSEHEGSINDISIRYKITRRNNFKTLISSSNDREINQAFNTIKNLKNILSQLSKKNDVDFEYNLDYVTIKGDINFNIDVNRISKQVNESKNYQVLYHYMPIFNLILFLEEYKKTGKFLLKSNTYGDDDGTFSYVSLSRNHSMNSSALTLNKLLCRITLDGEVLSQKYKLDPYFDNQYKDEVKDEREERMKITRFSDTYNVRKSNVWIGSRFEGDITDAVIRIDILNKPLKHNDEKRQGYVSGIDRYDDFNFTSFYDQNKIDNDHRDMLKELYEFLSKNKIDIPIKVVNKFSNYRYQDRYLSNWSRYGFKINKLLSV